MQQYTAVENAETSIALQQVSLEQSNNVNQSYNSQLNAAASPRALRQSRQGGASNINMQDSVDVRVRSSVENGSKIGVTDQSPDHTQFTILKAKLFNP